MKVKIGNKVKLKNGSPFVRIGKDFCGLETVNGYSSYEWGVESIRPNRVLTIKANIGNIEHRLQTMEEDVELVEPHTSEGERVEIAMEFDVVLAKLRKRVRGAQDESNLLSSLVRHVEELGKKVNKWEAK